MVARINPLECVFLPRDAVRKAELAESDAKEEFDLETLTISDHGQ